MVRGVWGVVCGVWCVVCVVCGVWCVVWCVVGGGLEVESGVWGLWVVGRWVWWCGVGVWVCAIGRLCVCLGVLGFFVLRVISALWVVQCELRSVIASSCACACF